jgi:predicted transcriptional regulator
MKKRRAESRTGMVVTTIALEPDLHRRLAVAAIDERAAMTVLIRQAVEEWLERRERKKKPRGP